MRPGHIAALALTLTACAPELDVPASRITAPRVIAVRVEPPEARPGAMVQATALVASPDGDVTEAMLAWRACEVPRSATDSTAVSSRCLDDDGGALTSLATGLRATLALPGDACMRVGPQVPPVGQDMVRVRAPDADITGGWQLPLRLDLTVGSAHETLVARVRIRCQPTDVPGATAVAYATQYRNNENPTLAALVDVDRGAAVMLQRHGGSSDGGDTLNAIGVTGTTLAVQWPVASTERYVLVDTTTRALVTRAEALEVTWFAAGGRFERDRTVADATGTRSVNRLRIDAGRTSPVTVWAVLRDDRGGVDFAVARFRVGG